MSNIKQVTPLTRIQPITKDQKKSSQEGSREDKNKKNNEQCDSRDQPGGSSHVDDYV